MSESAEPYIAEHGNVFFMAGWHNIPYIVTKHSEDAQTYETMTYYGCREGVKYDKIQNVSLYDQQKPFIYKCKMDILTIFKGSIL